MNLKLVFATLFLISLTGCSKNNGDYVEASGIIETTDVNISSKAIGTILKLNFREGDPVKRGDTLAAIDDSDLELQAAQLKAGVDLAKAQYNLLRNGSRIEDIEQADENVHQTKSSLENATQDLKRYQDLFKTGSITEKQFQDVQTKYDVSLRQYNSSKLNYEKLKKGSRYEDIAAAKARLVQSEAQLASTSKKISDCYVVAPTNGTITKRAVEEGEFVSTGATMLTISKMDVVKLKIYVAENELGKVKLGQSATLKIDTYKDKTYTGKVTYISPVAEFTPKNVQTKDDRVKLVFEVQIDIPNPNGELKSGITAEAVLN